MGGTLPGPSCHPIHNKGTLCILKSLQNSSHAFVPFHSNMYVPLP